MKNHCKNNSKKSNKKCICCNKAVAIIAVLALLVVSTVLIFVAQSILNQVDTPPKNGGDVVVDDGNTDGQTDTGPQYDPNGLSIQDTKDSNYPELDELIRKGLVSEPTKNMPEKYDGEIDTSDWVEHNIKELGITIKIPEKYNISDVNYSSEDNDSSKYRGKRVLIKLIDTSSMNNHLNLIGKTFDFIEKIEFNGGGFAQIEYTENLDLSQSESSIMGQLKEMGFNKTRSLYIERIIKVIPEQDKLLHVISRDNYGRFDASISGIVHKETDTGLEYISLYNLHRSFYVESDSLEYVSPFVSEFLETYEYEEFYEIFKSIKIN